MATLYSRNFGILFSKGKYIMNLDNDDLFLNDDLFDTVFKEAEKGNFDLVGFSAVNCKTYNTSKSELKLSFFHNHKDGLTIYQPELTYFIITGNDHHVWGRLTNSDLYKKAINNFGKNALGEMRNLCFLTRAEDSAMSVVIHRYASSYKYIKKYGIFHYISKTSASKTTKKHLKIYGELFFWTPFLTLVMKLLKGKNMLFYWQRDSNLIKLRIYIMIKM